MFKKKRSPAPVWTGDDIRHQFGDRNLNEPANMTLGNVADLLDRLGEMEKRLGRIEDAIYSRPTTPEPGQ